MHEGLECAMIAEYLSLAGAPLVRQGVLALRLILNQGDPSCVSNDSQGGVCFFDLVGDADNCDETREELARSLTRTRDKHASRYPSAAAGVSEKKLLLALDIMHRNAFKSGSIVCVFPLLALTNHSCSPNSVATIGYEQHVDGERFLVASVRALRTIKMGEELTISYVPLGLNPSEVRRGAIFDKHGFMCCCEACPASDGRAETDETLLEQYETHFGDVELTLDPLLVVFESIEEEMSSLSRVSSVSAFAEGVDANEEEDKFSDLNFLLARAGAGITNLKLGALHYLSLKLLVLSAEAALLELRRKEVVHFCQEWLRLMESASKGIQLLCDVHLMCRMLVINAECLADLFESSVSGELAKSRKCRNRVLEALDRAIAQAIMIYGSDYSLCHVLTKRKECLINVTEQL